MKEIWQGAAILAVGVVLGAIIGTVGHPWAAAPTPAPSAVLAGRVLVLAEGHDEFGAPALCDSYGIAWNMSDDNTGHSLSITKRLHAPPPRNDGVLQAMLPTRCNRTAN